MEAGSPALQADSLPAEPPGKPKNIGVGMCLVSHVPTDGAVSWMVAHQAPLSMGFSRQEYWSGLPFPTPGDHSDPRIKPESLASPALPGRFFHYVM